MDVTTAMLISAIRRFVLHNASGQDGVEKRS